MAFIVPMHHNKPNTTYLLLSLCSSKHKASNWTCGPPRFGETGGSPYCWNDTRVQHVFEKWLERLHLKHVLPHAGPGGRFKNTYELLNLRALKISKLHKNHIFQCMGKIFCVEFQRVPLKFHTKYLTHTLKDVDFIHIWKFKSSLI